MKNHKNLASWFVMIQSFSFCGLCCHHTPIGVGMGAGTAAVLPLFWRTERPLPIAKWGEMLKYVLIGARRGRQCLGVGAATAAVLHYSPGWAEHYQSPRTVDKWGQMVEDVLIGARRGWLSYHAPVLLHGLAQCAMHTVHSRVMCYYYLLCFNWRI